MNTPPSLRAHSPLTRADFHAAQGVLLVVRNPPPAPPPHTCTVSVVYAGTVNVYVPGLEYVCEPGVLQVPSDKPAGLLLRMAVHSSAVFVGMK